MTLQTKDTGDRAARLAGLLRNILKGNRKIQSANDAKLFFEAVRCHPAPSTCIEGIVASKHGIEALQLSVKVDLSPASIKSQTLQFINYLADDQLKLLADGQILQMVLKAIVTPPTFWNALVSVVKTGMLVDEQLMVFSWLCVELLSLPRSADVDIQDDVEAVVQRVKLAEASCPKTRRLGYKIQNLLQLRKSPAITAGDTYAPGGRHDNDFENFRNILVYPTTDEFLSTERPFYRRAKDVFDVDMAQRPAVHLDNMFRLTREDLLGELRSDWQNAQVRNRGQRSALTLRKLRPVGLDLGDDQKRKKTSLAIECKAGLERLQSVTPGSRKAWLQDNKNFIRHQAFGALYQGQEIFGFAFVERNLDGLIMSPPVITLQFTDDNAFKKALVALRTMENVAFTLVDTPVFAYEPILERLKNMVEIPLQDKLLNPSEAVDDFIPGPQMQPIIEQFTSSLPVMINVQNKSVNKAFQLDRSQQRSLHNALASKVSVIQGPPGTGKSFIGALAVHHILEHTNFKILVITYTNHALDQFLEDLMDLGINPHHMVRLGSKSTDRTSPLLMSSQRSGYRRSIESWALIDRLKEDANEHSEELKQAFIRYIQAQPSFEDIRDYLEFSEDGERFFNAFVVPTEEDGFKKIAKKGNKVKPNYLFNCWQAGAGPGVFEQHALSLHGEVWAIEATERRKLINKWLTAMLQEKVESVQNLARQYDLTQDQLDAQFSDHRAEILRGRRIIGCTTTAAAKYTKLLNAAQRDVVVVEEAGEIQEAHVHTAQTPSVKQLMLIGDHKQLRPKINNYNLTVEKGDGFDLNRSLFERLILQGHPYTSLNKQHRMHPDISVLVRELTYPELEDGPKTESREPIRGLEDRVTFVNHSHPEEENQKLADRRDQGAKSSKENIFEAKMVLKTVRYLAQQGYGTKNMVVLTPYLGQLRLIRDMLKDDVDPLLSDLDSHELICAGLLTQAAAKTNKSQLRLSTIDNYQGEEADIVLVSLTRSNNNGDIGFLAARERLNVLLSRARNCLVMFGNMDTYMQSKKGKDTWMPFFESMTAKSHLYDGLPIHCENHPEKTFLLQTPEDFDTCCPDGGCAEICGALLNCGMHNCNMRCHRVADHSKIQCPHKVESSCPRGHKMKVPCHKQKDKCSKCVQEDIDAERRIKRDLKLEGERLERQQAYKKELQEIQDEIDHHRRIIKDQKDQEEHKKTLDQQRAELAALKDTTQRILNAPKPQPPAAGNDCPPSSMKEGDELDMSDGAKKEWEFLKQFEGAKNEALDEIMGMIGLEQVKSAFLEIKDRIDTALRQDISIQKERYSCSLLGNPGTGKTTVARLYAKFLTSVAVIPGSCFHEDTGASLANAGVNGCKKIIENMLNNGGGVLFIDEAYQLTSGNSQGGGAVLDYLLAEVENLTGKIVFVLAGYDKQMESFFSHNPGLLSRFPGRMKFEDYTDDELLRILELNIHKKYKGRMKCEDGLKGLYCRIVTRRVGKGRGREGFGNARTIENTLKTISGRQAVRLSRQRRKGKKPDDLLFTKEDLIGPEPGEALSKSKAWQELQKLVGINTVKEAVRSLVDTVKQNYQRELEEQPIIEYSLNRVCIGNPGTGKTTVANLYGRILVDLGMLSNGEVVIRNPSDFVGAHIGESEKLTKGILAATLGKVLVIDEAYGLYVGHGATNDPFKTSVIDTIVADVQSVPGDDRCVLLLGYKDQMEAMFQNVNPGLSRRFPMSSAFKFEDFSSDELSKILDFKLKKDGFDATTQARSVVMEMLDRARNRPHFGNAGEINIMLDAAKLKHQSRLSRKETQAASVLDARDFDENFDRAERSDTDVMKLFQGTVGNEEVVLLLREYQENVQAMRLLDIDPKENIPFNFLFRGPPGTGKTTTAKKMGKVFYDMGFLSTAEVIECSATDLIGEYIGQTGPKVQQQLDKALGKVLFIDEAYRLAEGHFAKEAMDELVDATTKDKYAKRLLIILAGYENDINKLMMTNPGLTSRFPEVINFRSLTPEECVELLTQDLKARQTDLKAKGTHFDISALENTVHADSQVLTSLFFELSRQDNWASARDVKEAAKAIFRKTIKDRAGLVQGRLTASLDIIETELRRMLQERASRSKSANPLLQIPYDLVNPAPSHLPPSTIGPSSLMTATTHQPTQQRPPSPPSDEQEPEDPWQLVDDLYSPDIEVATRDAGVSDEVWEELQRDRQAEQEREEEYQKLLKAQREARDADREEIVKRLLEEERRRKEEEEARRQLQEMGACPAGFRWIRQAGGYRCAGGSHFMSDAALPSK
ncbi:P-loop containing nucleoside triphosphate hydrolase protein [Cryphonectria parasitica EP155]|uniref:P-loop containing nucleoside triphosphate hydrolase protein n=1 Tax=Cryphonectria parasitica (strain ATCC 38755 / EP155) TaxID=660469 RepID=A0A9P4XVA4_CRYP1|nr:P-loop containing nucleoside triphosphate hydrolase protein [Cryphonectria parasitica EP155]KAF3761456.1 P-loop containing nucleoside triphosphate hydrolase protein [Cryphonectria parasitica EP155]